jgi:hypothetical protein
MQRKALLKELNVLESSLQLTASELLVESDDAPPSKNDFTYTNAIGKRLRESINSKKLK